MSWKRQQTKQVFYCQRHSQGVEKLLSTCQEDAARVHSSEERSCGDLWAHVSLIGSLLGTSQTNRTLQGKSKHFLSRLKSPSCFHFLKAYFCSHYGSRARGRWVGSVRSGGHLSPFIPLRSLRSLETNKMGLGNICACGKCHLSPSETSLMFSEGSLSAHQR